MREAKNGVGGGGGGLSLRAIAGFACNQGFVFSLFYVGENRAIGVGSAAFERADLLATLAFMILSFALLRIASPQARAALLARPLLACYAALLVVGSFALTGLQGGAPILVLESALIGLPAGLMLAAWGRALGSRPIRRCVPEVFIAAALGAVACFAFSTVPVQWAPGFLKLLPLGSAWALRVFVSDASVREGGGLPADGARKGPRALSLGVLLSTPEERAETARLSGRMIVGTVLFGLAAGFVETYGSDPGDAAVPALPASLLLFFLFCAAALQLIASGGLRDAEGGRMAGSGEGPLDGAYRLAVLVMMAGFLFVPVLKGFGVPGEAIVLAGYLGLNYVLVSLFLVMARITGQDAAVSFSRGFTALFAGEIAGIALGNAIELASPSGEAPYAVVACAGLVALYAFLFLFTERDFSALSVIARDVDRFDDACRAIARDCRLSKREAEILPYALKGRTGERIAQELFITKSTVETHLRRIYAKTGVHGRQELIDLGERIARDLSEAMR